MSEIESAKSPTHVLPKYPLISRTKIRESFSSIFLCVCVSPKMFLVGEGNLKPFIQKTKLKKKMKCFQTSALENLWKISCIDVLVCKVL